MRELNFINDKEIDNLNSDKDLLETKRYAQTLKKTILSAETPFTIGLFGEWGSGKSSIVNTVQSELKNHKLEKIKFIKYDAWKYANDSFRRMFIKEVQNTLKFDGTDEFNSFYTNKTVDTKINPKFNSGYFVLITLTFIFIVLILPLFEMKKDLELTIQSIITFFAVAVAFFKNSFTEYKVTTQKPMIFAPEQFENIFDEMMSKSLKKYNIFSQMKEWFKGSHYEKNIDKVVIIIDNIDRCDKETAYELLTNIKNFLEREGIIFVVPIDDSALRRHLKDKNNEDGKEADEFLRKFFNVTLKIKHFQSRDLFMFTNDINKHHGLNLEPDTVDIIAKEYATNPRRIIQLFNNLISELNIVQQKYDRDFSSKYESLIALLLIVREEWSCVYKQIASKPHLLKKTDDIVFDEDSKIKENITHFLNRTKAVYENVNEQIIEKLVSNMDNDEKIPNEIIDNIKNSNYDSLHEYIKVDEDFKELLYYLIQELETEITRKTFKTGVLNRFKNIIQLNKLKEIPADVNKKLYRLVHNQQNELIIIIENLDKDNFDIFFQFVEVNRKQKINYLEEIVINGFRSIWSEILTDEEKKVLKNKALVWTSGLENYINNTENTEKLRFLEDCFLSYYDYSLRPTLLNKTEIQANKIKYIVGNDLIKYIVDRVESSFNSEYFEELIFLSKHKNIDLTHVRNIFTKMVNFEKEYQKNQDEAKNTFLEETFINLKQINKLLVNLISSKFNSSEIETFLNFLSSNQIIRFIDNNRIQNFNIVILNSISGKEEFQSELLNFYIEIYRLTLNNTSTVDAISNLINQHHPLELQMFELLLKLRDEHRLGLEPFFQILLSLSTINEKLFNLYEKLFILERIDSEKIKEKLEILLNKYLFEKNDTIEQFIITMLNHDKTKEILTNIVVELPTENIVELPKEIQHLTYDYLCENDKLFEIESKIDFIKEILAFDSKYKDCIFRVIVSKLQEKSKVKDALKILDGFSDPTIEQKSALYNALKNQEKHPELGESIVKLLKKYDDKIIHNKKL